MNERMFIRIEDGLPAGHPIIEKNFKQAFPTIDLNNLPENFKEFIRVPRPHPSPGKHIVHSKSTYVVANNYVTEVWTVTEWDLPLKEGGDEDGFENVVYANT